MRLNRQHVLAISVALALLLTVVGTAYAHLYSGHRWQYSTVMWYIGGGSTSVPASWQPEYRAAASTWTNAPGSFALSEVSPPQAQANLGAKYFSQDPNIPDGLYGWTGVWHDGNNVYVIAASSYLNRDYVWVTNGSSFPDVRTVAIHELGHWVEFKDSCSKPASVMCGNKQVKWNLTADDKSDLQAVYP